MASPNERLARDLRSQTFLHGVDHGFWKLEEHVETAIFITMLAPDGREYLLRLDCDEYGESPIGGRFVDPSTRQECAGAWPTGNGTFEGWIKFRSGAERFVCWPEDRFGVAHHANDWVRIAAWKGRENQLVSYLDFVRRLLWLPERGYARKSA